MAQSGAAWRGVLGKLKALWTWMGGNENQLKILFTLIAASYVLIQYIQKVDEGRTEKSLEYLKRYSQADVAAAKRKLDAFWSSKGHDEWKKKLNPENYDTVMRQLVQKERLLGDIHYLLGFYAELALCVNGKICDGQTACHFFFSDIQAHRHNYKWYFNELETSWKSGSPAIIDEFISISCKKQRDEYCNAYRHSPYCSRPTAST